MLDKGDSGKEGATLSTTTIFPYPPPCPPPPYFWQGTLLPESPCSLAREDTAAAAPQHHLSPTSIGSREARGSAPSTPLPCFSHRRGCAMRRCYTLSSALLQPQVCLRQVALPQRHLPAGSAIPLDKEDRRQGRGRLPSLPFPTFCRFLYFRLRRRTTGPFGPRSGLGRASHLPRSHASLRPSSPTARSLAPTADDSDASWDIALQDGRSHPTPSLRPPCNPGQGRRRKRAPPRPGDSAHRVGMLFAAAKSAR